MPGDQEHDHEACIDAVEDQRAEFIVRLLALADFFTRNADFPVPDKVIFTAGVDVEKRMPEAERVQSVIDWAERNAGTCTEYGNEVNGHVSILSEAGQTPINYLMTAQLNAPRKRYL